MDEEHCGTQQTHNTVAVKLIQKMQNGQQLNTTVARKGWVRASRNSVPLDKQQLSALVARKGWVSGRCRKMGMVQHKALRQQLCIVANRELIGSGCLVLCTKVGCSCTASWDDQ